MNNWRYILLLTTAFIFSNVNAQTAKKVVVLEVTVPDSVMNDSVLSSVLKAMPIDVEKIEIQNPKSSKQSLDEDWTIVQGDTVSMIIPERNYSRYDRGLFNFLFIPKGQWSFGITASYGEFNSNDIQILSILKDFNFTGSMFSIKPYISYFIRNNQAIGMRMGYTRNNAELGSLSLDFDEDINFTLRDVNYNSESYSASFFYRNYIGLDRNKRFAVFNEVDLQFASGSGHFSRLYNDKPRVTRTITTDARLNFSPGVCVFIQDYISFNVSFGVFGIYYKKESQTTDDVDEGSRVTSGANFRFNLFNLNLGIAVHI